MSVAKPLTGKRSEQALATRTRLLGAAITAFSERPYDEVAMGDIADAAGTAHGLPFHYFGTKRGLYLAALGDVAAQLSRAHEVTTAGAPRDQLGAMLRSHFEFMRAHEAIALALLRGGIGADPEAWQIFEAKRFETIDWICDVLALDSANPSLRLMLRALVGTIDEVTVQWIRDPRSHRLATLVDVLLDMFQSAIAAARRLDHSLEVAAAIEALHHPD